MADNQPSRENPKQTPKSSPSRDYWRRFKGHVDSGRQHPLEDPHINLTNALTVANRNIGFNHVPEAHDVIAQILAKHRQPLGHLIGEHLDESDKAEAGKAGDALRFFGLNGHRPFADTVAGHAHRRLSIMRPGLSRMLAAHQSEAFAEGRVARDRVFGLPARASTGDGSDSLDMRHSIHFSPRLGKDGDVVYELSHIFGSRHGMPTQRNERTDDPDGRTVAYHAEVSPKYMRWYLSQYAKHPDKVLRQMGQEGLRNFEAVHQRVTSEPEADDDFFGLNASLPRRKKK